ncbi:cytochrome C oxidase subunit IV family protein [Mycobacterium sp. CVI_P3]|uniref:Cytochrome C oxidase subunit IV family protein n=1 Tax=Mycobacterium pinniadriaticum TaxID=2994102 RepID=A0ABT3S9T7_9MYCO|nr:cytochrome C oxidase subunit IV family protein [Mycobacterium pinniadriaticum]MCX2929222.1 cytochrome C oxidase subunit IV family protein [Mycobacterium pinniadriaticum]MCX2935647.1 cytochrome C oxidase subunit IV family protein [Mycobacterium pinniadriaticum]
MTSERTITWTWLVLVAITVGSWWLAPAHTRGVASASVAVTCVVLGLALVKARLIIRNFMEVRTAPNWLKLATDAWLGVLFTAVLVIYLV